MAKKPATLRVYPNPYVLLDHEGRPASAVLKDPHLDHAYGSDTESRVFVGAVREPKETKAAGRHTPAEYDYTWTFSTDPVVLPLTPYYRQHILVGDLVAADVATWKTIGQDASTFVDAKAKLAAAKDAAIGRHAREYGEDAVPEETHAHWAEFHAPAKSPSAPATPPAPPAPAAPPKAAAKPAEGSN